MPMLVFVDRYPHVLTVNSNVLKKLKSERNSCKSGHPPICLSVAMDSRNQHDFYLLPTLRCSGALLLSLSPLDDP